VEKFFLSSDEPTRNVILRSENVIMNETAIKKVIDKNFEFWKLTNKEPLVAKIPFSGFYKKPYPVMGGRNIDDPERLLPVDMDIDRIIGFGKSNPEPFNGDMVHFAGCLYPESWMESLIGCPIYAAAFSCSSKPVSNDDHGEAMDRFRVEEAMDSEWAEVMNRLIGRLVEKAGADVPVRLLHFRGVIDMLAAFLGEEKLCFSLYDHPEKVAELGDRFADLYIWAAQNNISRIQPWNGGYASAWGVFAPGPIVDYQIDASNLFPIDTYRKHFLEFDKKVIRNFEYNLMHMHACGLHILDAVLEINNLKAVEITIERETGVFKKELILDSCKKIQAASKCVIINGELNEQELVEFKDKLDPSGLAIFYWSPL
jgi:hypothetical protein